MTTDKPCPICKGTGHIWAKPLSLPGALNDGPQRIRCNDCHGSGIAPAQEKPTSECMKCDFVGTAAELHAHLANPNKHSKATVEEKHTATYEENTGSYVCTCGFNTQDNDVARRHLFPPYVMEYLKDFAAEFYAKAKELGDIFDEAELTDSIDAMMVRQLSEWNQRVEPKKPKTPNESGVFDSNYSTVTPPSQSESELIDRVIEDSLPFPINRDEFKVMRRGIAALIAQEKRAAAIEALEDVQFRPILRGKGASPYDPYEQRQWHIQDKINELRSKHHE